MVDDVLIDGGDGWWPECNKRITRENRERLPPPPRRRVICFYFCVFFSWSIYSFEVFLNALLSIS